MNNQTDRYVPLITWFVATLLFIASGYKLSYAQTAYPPQEDTSELILTDQLIDQLAKPNPQPDGSVEAQLLKLNPRFTSVTISHRQNGVALEFIQPTPKGDKKLVLVTDPQMWFMTRMGPQAPSAEQRVVNWLRVAEQPQITGIERLNQNGNNYWKITAQLAEAAPPNAGPPHNPAREKANQADSEEAKSNDGFTQRIMGSSLVVNFKKGGFIMYLILMCSIGGLYIALERAYVLRRKRLIPNKFVNEVLSKFSKDNEKQNDEETINELIELCENKDIPAARTLKAGLMVYHEGVLGVKSAISSANAHEGAIMERGVGLLGVLANISPLLGLLGTVTGMIKAFEMISIGGSGRAEVVASGISEALVTTAGGLFVGIPLLLLYFFFQGKIEDILIDLEEFSLEVVEKLIARSE
jgi:biopolymer transport protein ExbB